MHQRAGALGADPDEGGGRGTRWWSGGMRHGACSAKAYPEDMPNHGGVKVEGGNAGVANAESTSGLSGATRCAAQNVAVGDKV